MKEENEKNIMRNEKRNFIYTKRKSIKANETITI